MSGPREPTIVAMSNAPEPLLDRYVLSLARGPRPAVGFLGTARGDAFVDRFHAAFGALDCEPSHLPLFERTPDPAAWVAAQDVIYVGGGNTRSMLAVWREWGLDRLLYDAWRAGTLLAGFSAGAICWFEQGVTDSAAGPLQAMTGLGWLPGSCCPHYDGEPERRPACARLLAAGELAPGLALGDGTAAVFEGTQLRRIAAARPGASAWRLDAEGREEPLPTEPV